MRPTAPHAATILIAARLAARAASTKNFCGASWGDASSNCDARQACPLGTDEECSFGGAFSRTILRASVLRFGPGGDFFGAKRGQESQIMDVCFAARSKHVSKKCPGATGGRGRKKYQGIVLLFYESGRAFQSSQHSGLVKERK